MRLYISGPVTGMLDRNQVAFEEAAKALVEAGHAVSVPTRFVDPRTECHDAMRICLAELLRCQGVALLPGWERSFGCGVEVAAARACGMDVLTWDAWADKEA